MDNAINEKRVAHAGEHHDRVHHEEHDINVRAVLWFAVAFVVTGIVVHLALWFLYKGFAAIERERTEPPVTLVANPQREIPPSPRLQPFPERAPEWAGVQQRALFKTPVDDMEDLRAWENRMLTSYGFADDQQERLRIPIDRAMELVVQRGLPVRPAKPEETAP